MLALHLHRVEITAPHLLHRGGNAGTAPSTAVEITAPHLHRGGNAGTAPSTAVEITAPHLHRGGNASTALPPQAFMSAPALPPQAFLLAPAPSTAGIFAGTKKILKRA